MANFLRISFNYFKKTSPNFSRLTTSQWQGFATTCTKPQGSLEMAVEVVALKVPRPAGSNVVTFKLGENKYPKVSV
jgi:hypothetical protein